MPDPSPDTPSVCPGSGCSPTPEAFRERNGSKVRCSHCGARVEVYVYRLNWRTCQDVYFADHTPLASPAAPGSSSPDTAALLALRRVADNLSAEDDPDWHTVNVMRAAADALEAQASRITELEQFLIRMGLRPDHLVP